MSQCVCFNQLCVGLFPCVHLVPEECQFNWEEEASDYFLGSWSESLGTCVHASACVHVYVEGTCVCGVRVFVCGQSGCVGEWVGVFVHIYPVTMVNVGYHCGLSVIYSTFWVSCPDCDLKSALHYTARDIGNHSYWHVTVRARFAVRWALDSIWVKYDQNPLQPCWQGGSHKKDVALIDAADELIVEAFVGMWLVETICVDLLKAIDNDIQYLDFTLDQARSLCERNVVVNMIVWMICAGSGLRVHPNRMSLPSDSVR